MKTLMPSSSPKRLPLHATAIGLLAMSCVAVTALADEYRSDFLDNTEQLQPMDDPWISYGYMAPGFEEKIASTRVMVIEQPEIHIAADSRHKGIKPDEMKLLADTFRDYIATALSDVYQIAVTPGPDTLYLRIGLTNVYLKKKGRRLIGYTPVGLVVGTAKRVLLDDFTDKVLLTEVVVEFELLDSDTGERVAAMILELGDASTKKTRADWEQLETAMGISAARLRCRFKNVGLPEGERQDCTAITEP